MIDFSLFAILTSIFTLSFVILILRVVFKILIKKKFPNNYYAPFDYITGQSVSEYREEIKEEEEEDEAGDDKDKNKKLISSSFRSK